MKILKNVSGNNKKQQTSVHNLQSKSSKTIRKHIKRFHRNNSYEKKRTENKQHKNKVFENQIKIRNLHF